jgi:hypothetical protein
MQNEIAACRMVQWGKGAASSCRAGRAWWYHSCCSQCAVFCGCAALLQSIGSGDKVVVQGAFEQCKTKLPPAAWCGGAKAQRALAERDAHDGVLATVHGVLCSAAVLHSYRVLSAVTRLWCRVLSSNATRSCRLPHGAVGQRRSELLQSGTLAAAHSVLCSAAVLHSCRALAAVNKIVVMQGAFEQCTTKRPPTACCGGVVVQRAHAECAALVLMHLP